MLLERRGINPNIVNNFGQTPLFEAAPAGHEGLGKMLLARLVNPNIADNDGHHHSSEPLRRDTIESLRCYY